MVLRQNLIAILSITLLVFWSCSNGDDQGSEDDNNLNSGLSMTNQASIGGSGDEFGIDIVATNNGFIIGGVNDQEQPYILGIDDNFEIIWEQSLGISGVGGFEKVIATEDGNYVAAGFTEHSGNEFDLDLYAVKFDSDGTIIWNNALGFNYVTDTTVDLIETSNGDLIIAGTKLAEASLNNASDATKDILLTRIDANGNIIWSNIYGNEGNESLASVIEEDNGNLLIGGSVVEVEFDNNGNIDGYLPGDILIIRTNANGEVIQEQTFGSPDSDGSARIQQLSNGQIVVVASTNGTGGDVTTNNMGESDVWLFSLSNSLSITNQVNLGGAGSDFAFQLLESNSSEYFLVGRSNSNTIGPDNLFSPTDYWILKLSSGFSVIDELFLGGSDSDSASGAILLNNRLVMVGSTISNDGDVLNNNGSWDIWITIIEDFD